MGRALAACAAAALLLPAAATAKVNPEFDRLHARPGDRVRLVQAHGFGLARGDWVRVYLITVRQATAFAWPDGRGAIATRDGAPPRRLTRHYLGTIRGDGRSLAFRLPRVPPGRYTTFLWTSWNTHGPGRLNDTPDRYVLRPDRGILRVRR